MCKSNLQKDVKNFQILNVKKLEHPRWFEENTEYTFNVTCMANESASWFVLSVIVKDLYMLIMINST